MRRSIPCGRVGCLSASGECLTPHDSSLRRALSCDGGCGRNLCSIESERHLQCHLKLPSGVKENVVGAAYSVMTDCQGEHENAYTGANADACQRARRWPVGGQRRKLRSGLAGSGESFAEVWGPVAGIGKLESGLRSRIRGKQHSLCVCGHERDGIAVCEEKAGESDLHICRAASFWMRVHLVDDTFNESSCRDGDARSHGKRKRRRARGRRAWWICF